MPKPRKSNNSQSEWEMLHDKMKCAYFRKQVRKGFEEMLAAGRIDQDMFNRCVRNL